MGKIMVPIIEDDDPEVVKESKRLIISIATEPNIVFDESLNVLAKVLHKHIERIDERRRR